jgi:hypothetical protein
MTSELSDLDHAHHLLGDTIDLDAQLLAIRGVLRRNAAAQARLSTEIHEIVDSSKSARGNASWRLDDEWVDRLHDSVYQDAAHSLAAVGMLAPLLETVFVRIFTAIGARADWPRASDGRLNRAGGDVPSLWDPQVYFAEDGTRKGDLIRGIRQLARETGLAAELPADYEAIVQALFTYRNRMFHSGFEWPVADREHFDRLIEMQCWPAEWFTRSTSGGATWIVYMGEDFIRRCLDFIGELLEAAGAFARQRYELYGYAAPGEQAELEAPDWLLSRG